MDIENLEYLNNGKVDQNQIDNYELNDEFIDNSYADQNCDDVIYTAEIDTDDNTVEINDDVYVQSTNNNNTVEAENDNAVEAENDNVVVNKQHNKRGRPKASIKGHKIYNLSCRDIQTDQYNVIEAFESLPAIARYLKDKKVNISYSKVQAIYNKKYHDFLKISFINE